MTAESAPGGVLSKLKRVGQILLAIAAIIGTVGGAGKVLSGSWSWWNKQHAPRSAFDRTPSLGLSFEQGGVAAPMLYRDKAEKTILVKLTRSSFTMRLPRVAAGTAVEICAWDDASIFKLHDDMAADAVPYLRQGRGMADSRYGSGRLGLSNEARNYFIGDRLRPVGDESHVFVSRLSQLGAQDQPLAERHEPVYLVVYVDRNADRHIDLDEFEQLELDF